MKIASYNILSGGFTSYNYDSPLPERLLLLQKAIKKIDADFIGLIDTFRWDSIFTGQQLGKLFSYTRAYCINLNDNRLIKLGHNNGIAVLTNLPVKRFETISLGTRNAVKTILKIKNSDLDIFSVYLDDLSEDTRVAQTQLLVKKIRDNIPAVVMGDFNTLDVKDVAIVKEAVKEFAGKYPQLYGKISPVYNEMKKGKVIKLLKDFGLKDANINRNSTYPTKLFPVLLDQPIIRIDHAFYTGNTSVKNFNVLKNPVFDKTSDHYPITFDIS